MPSIRPDASVPIDAARSSAAASLPSPAAAPPPGPSAPDAPPPALLLGGLPRAPRRRHDHAGRAVAQSIARAALRAWAQGGDLLQQVRQGLASSGVLRCLQPTNPSRDLDLSALMLRELPPYVDTLSRLKSLLLTGNALRQPPDLSPFRELRILSIGHNQLRAAPELNAQSRLTHLSLMGNRIGIPPRLSGLKLLEEANLADNRLTAMPDVRGLERLRELDLSDNRMRTVPVWIQHLPPSLAIDLRGNPLGAAAIAHLHDLRVAGVGPRVLFPLACPESGAEASLSGQLDFWLDARPEASTQGQTLKAQWAGVQQEFNADNFALLLSELSVTADFQNSDGGRAGLVWRVSAVLESLLQDEALRAECFDIAEQGVGACGDRVALAFSDIEVAVLAHRLAGDPLALWDLARSQFRLAQVDLLALKDRDALQGTTEDVEVVLAYRRRLADVLRLPLLPGEMLYEHLVAVRPEKLEQARQEVLAAERAPGALVDYIAALPFWRTSLMRHEPDCTAAVAAAREDLLDRLQALEREAAAPGGTLTSADYAARDRQLNREHAARLDAIYAGFTAVYSEKVPSST